jgi:hypothetical protein
LSRMFGFSLNSLRRENTHRYAKNCHRVDSYHPIRHWRIAGQVGGLHARKYRRMQHLIILCAFLAALAVAGAALYRRLPLRRWILFSALLVALALYESYMSFVWEHRVHSPIRLDMFAEIPLLVILLLLGFISVLWRNRQ